MINKTNITGIILAGGKSSRMGEDKGLLLLNGKPLVQYSIDALKPLVSEIIIVSDNANYAEFGLRRISDIRKNSGPVAGICSGLEASYNDYNLVLSCDIPLITPKILEILINAIDDTTEIIQVESKGKSMPLIALYKRQVKDCFNKLLNTNQRCLRFAVENCNYKTIELKKEQQICTTNVNTIKDLKAIENAYNN